MAVGDHRIDPEEIRATATIIRRVVAELERGQTEVNRAATDLAGAGATAWSTPKASKKFNEQWTEWTNGLTKLLDVGPDFAQWLENYAKDAEAFDSHYA